MLFRNLIRRNPLPCSALRCLPVRVVEDTAEPLFADDATGAVWRLIGKMNKAIAAALTWSFLVVLRGEFADAPGERGCHDGAGVRVPGDGLSGRDGASAAGRLQLPVDGCGNDVRRA